MKIILSEAEILNACVQWAKDYKSTALYEPRIVVKTDDDGEVIHTYMEADLEAPETVPLKIKTKR